MPNIVNGKPVLLQQTVLQTAMDLFSRQGFDATSMGNIAATLGVTQAALYYYFPSKIELLRCALEPGLMSLEASLHEPEARNGAAIQRLEFVLRRMVDVQVEHRSSVKLLLHLRGNNEVEINAINRRRAFDEGITTLTSLAQLECSISQDVNPRSVARLVIGAINSGLDWFDPGDGRSPGQLADEILAIAFGGLRVPRVG